MSILTHYISGSASPDWIRAMLAIECEPEAAPLPPAVPTLQPVPVPAQEAA